MAWIGGSRVNHIGFGQKEAMWWIIFSECKAYGIPKCLDSTVSLSCQCVQVVFPKIQVKLVHVSSKIKDNLLYPDPQTFFPAFLFLKTSPFLSPPISTTKHTLTNVDISYMINLFCNKVWSSRVVAISRSCLHCVRQKWKTVLHDRVMRIQRVR